MSAWSPPSWRLRSSIALTTLTARQDKDLSHIEWIDTHRPDKALLSRAGQILREGGLVAFPTETVYGLGANALDESAVTRIFLAKKRPLTDPVIVHIANPDRLDQVAAEVTPTARRLIDRFWPGPLTLVMPRAQGMPSSVSAGLPTVAVRMPAHPVALGLITAADRPIAAPSANRFGRPSATLVAHVAADLADSVELILDAGPASLGIESTILDISSDGPPVLLRPGGVARADLEAVVGPLGALSPTTFSDDAAQPAPGMLTRHYSPLAEMVVVIGNRDDARHRLGLELRHRTGAGARVGALLVNDDADLVRDLPVLVSWLGREHRLMDVAARLFAAMRELDEAGVSVICARDFGRNGIGLAIRDRLVRAAAGRVIDVG